VGFWNEEEVINALKDWRLTTRPTPQPTPPPVRIIGGPANTDGGVVHAGYSSEKKAKARIKVNNIHDVEKAIHILDKLIDLGVDQIYDTILND
jgi:hypothetical protein